MQTDKNNYLLLLQNMPISVVYCKPIFKDRKAVDFVYLDVNSAFEKDTGLKDIINKKASDVIPDMLEQNPELFELYGDVATTGKSGKIEVYIGPLKRWLDVSAYCPEKGYVLAVHENITKRKLAEQALKKSEEMYRAIIEHAEEGIFIAQDEKLKYVNLKTCEIARRSKEELLSHPFVHFLHPADRDMVVERHRARISGNLEGLIYQFRLTGRDDSLIWVELAATKVEWEGRPATLNFITDVTARKIAEDELKRSSRLMADIIEFLPDPTFVVNEDQKVIFWNHAIEEMTGIPASEMVGKGDYAYTVPFYGEARPLLMDLIWKDNEAAKSKYQHITYSGNSLFTEVFCPALYGGRGAWVFVKASPLYDSTGHLTGAIESVRDITASRNAVEDLRKSEEQYRLLAETAEDIIWTVDPDMKFTYISPSVKKMRGFTPEEAMLQSLSDMLTPASFQSAMQELSLNIKNIKQGGFTAARMETEQYCKDGSTVWTESVVRSLHDSMGHLTGFLGISRDITERRATDQALIESEEKFRRIFENSNDAIFISSRKGRFIDANESMCNMFGYPRDEILRIPVKDVYKNPKDRAAFQAEVEKTGSIRNYEIELRKKDGATVYGMLNATVRRDNNGNIIGYQGIFRDITEIKQLQNERQKIAKLESIGTLAGGIAHDFNNILQGILGNIGLAMLETGEGDRIYEYLKEAEKASLNARNLTYQFLTFSKGGAPIKKKVLLDSCIKDAVTLALRGSNVNYSLSIKPDLWAVDADEGQIGQVITNIVLNAQQAMPKGGTVEVNAENIELTGQGSLSRSLPVSNGNYIRIAVTDHGTGIPPEHIGNIFDPYFTTKQRGSGLGLATSYSIVRKHNGHIGVESRVGKGSTFFIYLPASNKEPRRKTIKKEQLFKGAGTVLLMDDEEMVTNTAGKMLKKLGYGVETAANGAEAIQKYRTAFDSGNPFRLVILDLTIPGGMGGIETIQELKRINPQLKAIVSSGYADESAMAEFTEYGFKGMVAKPYTPAQLSKVLLDVAKG